MCSGKLSWYILHWLTFIYLSRGVVGLTVMVLSVMFLLRIVFILLLVRIKWGEAGAFVRARRHWF